MSGSLRSVAAYLRDLPAGADSYPDCTCKGSLVRWCVTEKPLPPSLDLPPAIRALLREPPPVNAWVPEVHKNVITLATFDHHFGGESAPFQAWMLEMNRRLLSGPLYRALFLFISPERLLLGAEKRFSAFRQGMTLHVIERSHSAAVLRLAAPPRLEPLELLCALGTAFQAAVEKAGAQDVRVEVEPRTETETLYRLGWR